MSEQPPSEHPPGEKSPLRDPEGHARPAMLAGRYRLDHVLGQGGMGSVWAGYDIELERAVAVKLMAPEVARSEELRARFNREAKAAARLRTRHVVAVHDFGVDNDTPYIVMEKLEGEDLRKRLGRAKRLTLPQAAAILAQAAKALEQARRAGIVHRDLKPGNVFLARVDDEEVVKILDFGVAKNIARSRGADTTKSGVVLGSPAYLSPEQSRGRTLDHRSDLWSLTAVIFRAITGRPVFSGESDGDILVKICTERPAAPSTIEPSIPVQLDAFFAKAFSIDPDDRYQSASELSRAFERAAGLPRMSSRHTGSSIDLSSSDTSDLPPISSSSGETPWSDAPSITPSRSGDTPASGTAERPPEERLDATTEDLTTRPRDAVGSRTGAAWTASEQSPIRPTRRISRVALVLAVVAVAAAASFVVYGSRGAREPAGAPEPPATATPAASPMSNDTRGETTADAIAATAASETPEATASSPGNKPRRARPVPKTDDAGSPAPSPSPKPSSTESSKELSKRRWGY